MRREGGGGSSRAMAPVNRRCGPAAPHLPCAHVDAATPGRCRTHPALTRHRSGGRRPDQVLHPGKGSPPASAQRRRPRTPRRRNRHRGPAGVEGVPTVVVCDDEAVADLAVHCGCEPMMTMTRGLNAVVAEAMEHLRHRGVARVMVAHADLPRPEALTTIATDRQLAIVPDHRLDGTNVLILPSDEARCVTYGPGSFRRHLRALTALARDRHLRLDVLRDHQLGLDLDHPSDLSHPVTSTTRHQGAPHDR